MEELSVKEQIINIVNENIKRDGIEKLMDWLINKSDFFVAPASTRFHGAFEGGLAIHSLNVYNCLKDYLERPRVKEYIEKYNEPLEQRDKLIVTDESIAIVALFHDLCKVNVYQKDFRNVKNANGQWEKVPTYKFEDNIPYGHGEKSVYMITNGLMKLTRHEAMAIRWHMGFSGVEDNNTVGRALEMYPLAFALCTADMEASYFLE